MKSVLSLAFIVTILALTSHISQAQQYNQLLARGQKVNGTTITIYRCVEEDRIHYIETARRRVTGSRRR